MKGRRLKNFINRVKTYSLELHDARSGHSDSVIIKQIEIQLKVKKELFLNTLNELMHSPNWLIACNMSDNVRHRRKQIMK